MSNAWAIGRLLAIFGTAISNSLGKTSASRDHLRNILITKTEPEPRHCRNTLVQIFLKKMKKTLVSMAKHH